MLYEVCVFNSRVFIWNLPPISTACILWLSSMDKNLSTQKETKFLIFFKLTSSDSVKLLKYASIDHWRELGLAIQSNEILIFKILSVCRNYITLCWGQAYRKFLFNSDCHFMFVQNNGIASIYVKSKFPSDEGSECTVKIH